jgi:two-component system LytT family response regulator
MNKLSTLLVDDEPRGLSSLRKLLEMNCPEVEVTGCCSNADEAKETILRQQPQLVFLDIAMPGKSGLDMLQELGEIGFEIIFVTAHDNFMKQAFHFSAVDYILKPVEEDLLIAAVKRAGKRIQEKTSGRQVETFLYNLSQKDSPQKMKLCIPSLKGFQVIEIRDIIYAEASTNYTNFHFVNRPLICSSRPLHDYEELLADSCFVRIHKSFIVNLEHIREYIRGEGGAVLLSNGHEVEVARRKKDLLMTRMKDYFKF